MFTEVSRQDIPSLDPFNSRYGRRLWYFVLCVCDQLKGSPLRPSRMGRGEKCGTAVPVPTIAVG